MFALFFLKTQQKMLLKDKTSAPRSDRRFASEFTYQTDNVICEVRSAPNNLVTAWWFRSICELYFKNMNAASVIREAKTLFELTVITN